MTFITYSINNILLGACLTVCRLSYRGRGRERGKGARVHWEDRSAIARAARSGVGGGGRRAKDTLLALRPAVLRAY